LAAVRDPGLYWDIVPEGYSSMSSNPEMGLQWHSSRGRNHAYLVEKIPARYMEDTIEDLMMDLPNARKKDFFTLPLDYTLRCVRGSRFGYRMPYYNYDKGEINVRFRNLPAWLKTKGDSIYGIAPETASQFHKLQAVLYVNKKPSDTVCFSIKVLKDQPLITHLIAASGASESFKITKLEPGDKIYVDRPFRLKDIKDKYLDYTWVVSPTNDGHRYDLGEQFISFKANKSVTVVVGYDKNFLELKPDWLKDWSDTKDEITDDAGGTFHLYKKVFPKGKIVLGNNTTDFKTLRLMYLILLKETGEISN